MDTLMAITILTEVRDELRGIRREIRKWTGELRRIRLGEKEEEEAERNEGNDFREVEGLSPSAEGSGDGESQRTERESEKKKRGEGKKRREKDGREKWESEVGKRNFRIKGTVDEGEKKRLELQRISGKVMRERVEAQMKVGERREARTMVRLKSPEIKDGALGEKREICRKAKSGVEEDLIWSERAARFRLRQKVEEE